MKKKKFVLSIGLIIVIGNFLYAQDSKKSIEANNRKTFLTSIRKLSTLENIDLLGNQILNRNEINIWAVRDFIGRFEQIDSVQWFFLPNGGYEAYFTQDGYGDRVYYNKKGGWLQSVISYDEDKLPRDIRSAVKSTYYDFDIVLVEEVHIREGIEYVVHLEDNTRILVLRVQENGDREILQDLRK